MADTGKTIALIKALSGGGGSGGGVLVVTDTGGTLDKTWQEIHDAVLPVYNEGGNRYVLNDYIDGKSGEYGVRFFSWDGELIAYTTSSADDYPVKFTE